MRNLAGALIAGALITLSSVSLAIASNWLDAKPLAAWNAPGAGVPKAPRAQSDNLGRCSSQLRSPETTADRVVSAAGWKLFGPYQLYGGTAIVLGQSDADGMCRPEGYQAFVFVRGRFAGTLAPKPIAARTDGSLETPQIFAATSFSAQFARYAESDPLCCPSRTTSVEYKVERRGSDPVVVPVEATTSKNQS